MNEKLLYDIKVAISKMRKSEEIKESKMKSTNECIDKILAYKKEYEEYKQGKGVREVHKSIVFMLLIIISIILMFLGIMSNGNMLMVGTGIILLLVGPILSVVLINKKYDNEAEFCVKKADNWWKKHAEPNITKLEAIIEDNKKAAEDVIKDDYIISAIPKYNRCSEVLISLYHIVAKGYANNIKDAYAICESNIIRENRRREYREYLREEREEREHELETLDNINSKLDSLNKSMAEREFYEDLILMDLASRE